MDISQRLAFYSHPSFLSSSRYRSVGSGVADIGEPFGAVSLNASRPPSR